MVEFTLLELHFEDSDLTANAPYSHGDNDATRSDASPTSDDSSRSGTIFALLVGLGFSIAVAYLVRKKVTGGDGELDAVDEDESAIDIEA